MINTTQTLSTWVFNPQPNPHAKIRLICFPYAGGGASIYRTWPNHLSDKIDVWAIRLPGRENRLREAPFNDIPLLIEALLEILRSHLTMPFVFFGHSMGAMLSFELTHKLRQEQLPQPSHLFVSGQRAPQIPNPLPKIHHLPQADFIENVLDYNGIPAMVLQEPELMELMLPILRADFTKVETYQYRPMPPLACPISVFGGESDANVALKNLEMWGHHTSSRFTIHTYPGDHFFIRHVEAEMVKSIEQDLLGSQIN